MVTTFLSLAASPTFAMMALACGTTDTGVICSTAPGAFPFGSMTLMYALMSAFHLPPWIRIVFPQTQAAFQ